MANKFIGVKTICAQESFCVLIGRWDYYADGQVDFKIPHSKI